MATTLNSNRNGTIELLRLVFCATIIGRHSKILLTAIGLPYLFERGSLGVDFFFILSGLLMAMSIKKKDDMNLGDKVAIGAETRGFMLKKLSGLMPEVPLACLFAYIISYITIYDGADVTNLIKHALSFLWEALLISETGLKTEAFHMGIWYISAMLLAMLLLYPIARRNYDMFSNVVAPLLALFLIGALNLINGTTLGPFKVVGGVMYTGFIRAVGEIALGCVLFQIATRIKECRLSAFARTMITIIFLVSLTISLYWILFGITKEYDTVVVLLEAIIIVCAFSGQLLFHKQFNNKVFIFLGKFSLPLYLCHVEIAKGLCRTYKGLSADSVILNMPAVQQGVLIIGVYLLSTIVLALIVYLLSKLYRKNREKIHMKFKQLCIEH